MIFIFNDDLYYTLAELRLLGENMVKIDLLVSTLKMLDSRFGVERIWTG
jgi:hypothetical protein